MDHVISKKHPKEEVEKACENYAKHLEKNCTKKDVIGYLSRIHRDYFPDELCIAHLK